MVKYCERCDKKFAGSEKFCTTCGARLVEIGGDAPKAEKKVAPVSSGGMQYKGFLSRFFARFIDGIVLILLLFGMAIFTGILFNMPEIGAGLWYIANPLYFIYFHGSRGATPGKNALGMKVVKEDGSDLTYMDAFLRFIGSLISNFAFGLGWLWILWDAKKQGWHDKIARTVVISTE